MKKNLSGWMESVIIGGAGVGGLLLGMIIARVIGMADGLGMVIGMMAGIIVGFKIIEKRKKEEFFSEDIEEGELLTDEEEKQVWEEFQGKEEKDEGDTS